MNARWSHRNDLVIQVLGIDTHGLNDFLSHNCAAEENWLHSCTNTAPPLQKEPVHQNGKLDLDMATKREIPAPRIKQRLSSM